MSPASHQIWRKPSQHSMSGHNRSASETPFHGRLAKRHSNGVSLAGRWWPVNRYLLGKVTLNFFVCAVKYDLAVKIENVFDFRLVNQSKKNNNSGTSI